MWVWVWEAGGRRAHFKYGKYCFKIWALGWMLNGVRPGARVYGESAPPRDPYSHSSHRPAGVWAAAPVGLESVTEGG